MIGQPITSSEARGYETVLGPRISSSKVVSKEAMTCPPIDEPITVS